MEKELDPDVIKATQSSLGKYVKRPPLSEKLLKKPPFRFLHDIVTTVMKTTGFFEGLFEEQELISENVKDRDSKILFLSKVVSVLNTTTGKSLNVKPSKIVAGLEPEYTNELLQCIAFALDNKLSSKEAVEQYINGTKPDNKTDKKKEITKHTLKSNDTKKLTSRSSEKLVSSRRETAERSLTRNDKPKADIAKSKQKEKIPTATESQTKKVSTKPSKTLTKNSSVEKQDKINKNKRNDSVEINTVNDNKTTDNLKNDRKGDEVDIFAGKNDIIETDDQKDVRDSSAEKRNSVQHLSLGTDQDSERDNSKTSYVIAETDLNSSLSSQDLMEVSHGNHDRDYFEDNQQIKQTAEAGAKRNEQSEPAVNEQLAPVANNRNDKSLNDDTTNAFNENTESSRSQTSDSASYVIDNNTPLSSKENTQTVSRPKSVRPSSSRPGAPRLREKHENIVSADENLLLGKVNIIVENDQHEEEEDSSIIVVEQQEEALSMPNAELQLSSHQQHGALVQQILDSQKEYSQIAGKTEIEWQFGAQKAREAVNQEIEQLRYNIQGISRVANPLGKVLDHIQEDVEVMRQELQQWTKTYEEASKELVKQKTANEDSLFPLHTKLKQLDADIIEKRDKINDLKIIIHKNSSRIEILLASGDVQ